MHQKIPALTRDILLFFCCGASEIVWATEGELLVLATEAELIVRFRSLLRAGAGRDTREGELLVLPTEGELLLLNGNGNRLALSRSAI